MKKYTFRISAPLFRRLRGHLFPGDDDEHGTVIAAGISETNSETRFLAREVFLAKDGVDYVPGTFGYRALTPDFVARVATHCARQRLCYFAIHCHGGMGSVEFSHTDLKAHERGYPALLDITSGGPVGALVFAASAVAGRVWTRQGIAPLDHLTVIGPNHVRLSPKGRRQGHGCPEMYARQSLLFGAAGQRHLAASKVGIIGLGGVGSLVSELLARLGVGTIVAVDFDRMEISNLSRVVGASTWDAMAPLARSPIRLVRWIGSRLASHKVRVARRLARIANPRVRFRAIVGDVVDQAMARQLRDCDFLFLCADPMQCRLVFNALVHQYLIPGFEIGSKVPVDPETGAIGNVFSAARLVLPYAGGGCLLCNQLVSPDRLNEEALSPRERTAYAYVNDPMVQAPSVITLNALAASQAVNDFLFSFLGLVDEERQKDGYLMHFARERRWQSVDCASVSTCPHCGPSPQSILGRGDSQSLPCRQNPRSSSSATA